MDATAGHSATQQPRLPLVVDLDGTLLLTDTLDEQIAEALFRRPLHLARALPELGRDRAALKRALASEVDLSTAALPFREDLLVWLRDQAAAGRQVHLWSAATQSVVDAIARRLGFFASATGSGDENLKGPAKAAHLARTFPEGFVYVGDSAADLAVWKVASGVVLAGASRAVAEEARALGKPVEAEFADVPLSPREWAKATASQSLTTSSRRCCPSASKVST